MQNNAAWQVLCLSVNVVAYLVAHSNIDYGNQFESSHMNLLVAHSIQHDKCLRYMSHWRQGTGIQHLLWQWCRSIFRQPVLMRILFSLVYCVSSRTSSSTFHHHIEPPWPGDSYDMSRLRRCGARHTQCEYGGGGGMMHCGMMSHVLSRERRVSHHARKRW